MKTIEYNVLNLGVTEEFDRYNLEHKSVIDRIFFEIKNSFVEFVFEDSPEGYNEATALRIIKDSKSDCFKLEVMRLPNMLNLYLPYRPKPKIFRISKQFAEKMHGKTAMLINNFKGEGIPLVIVDKYKVTFRCVVEDELWILSVHCPQNRALQLSDLFR